MRGVIPSACISASAAAKGAKIDIEIVGVVKDSKNTDVRQTVHPFVFLPYSQSEQAGNATFYVRTNQDPAALTVSVRNLVEGLDSNLPIYDVRTLTAQVDDIMFTDRLVTVFSLALGLLASLLAAVGLYGVMAYVVARRTREIGIRMALGATQKSVAWMMVREILGNVGRGIGVGLIAAYANGPIDRIAIVRCEGQRPIRLRHRRRLARRGGLAGRLAAVPQSRWRGPHGRVALRVTTKFPELPEAFDQRRLLMGTG